MRHTIVVTRSAGVRRDDLHALDHDVAGTYPIEAANEEKALDEFHNTVPIKVLDDFYIDIQPNIVAGVKGLHCSVLRDAGNRYDCTNGGATANVNSVTLCGNGVSGPFEPSIDSPALWLEYDLNPKGARGGYLMVANVSWLRELGLDKGPSGEMSCFSAEWSGRHQVVRVRAVPIVDGKPKCGMFGGNFISTSDSRFPMTAPIPVFDRFE